ncbi:MAG: YCF48-related protein [Pyrinomonadaceae bacterium]
MKLKITLIAVVLLMGAFSVNAEWVRINTRSFATLKDIFFQDANTGWIAGTDGTLLRTDDGGTTWLPVQKFTTDAILQVHFTDASTGWLLCERNIFSRGRNPTSYLRKTTDGGIHWEKIEFEEADRERVTRLLFAKDGTATAFGEGGIFYKLQEDGITWKKSLAAIHFLLLDGAYSEARTGAIVGAGGTIVFTEDGGLTWEPATVLGGSDARINSVVFTSQKQAWAVGSGGSILSASGGGRLWRKQPQDETEENLNDLVFVDTREGYVVGDNGTMLRTVNGGTTWTALRSRVTHNLNKIAFNGKVGFAIGMGGTLLASNGLASDAGGQKPEIRRPN